MDVTGAALSAVAIVVSVVVTGSLGILAIAGLFYWWDVSSETSKEWARCLGVVVLLWLVIFLAILAMQAYPIFIQSG